MFLPYMSVPFEEFLFQRYWLFFRGHSRVFAINFVFLLFPFVATARLLTPRNYFWVNFNSGDLFCDGAFFFILRILFLTLATLV